MSNFQNTKPQTRLAWVPPTTVRLSVDSARNSQVVNDIADVTSEG